MAEAQGQPRRESENSGGVVGERRRRSSLADLMSGVKEKLVGPSQKVAQQKKLIKQESEEKFKGLVELMYECNSKEEGVYEPVKEEDMLAVAAEEYEKFKRERGAKLAENSSNKKIYQQVSEIYSH